MASYKLPLKRLSLGVQEFTYHLGKDFFNDIEPLEVRGGNVDAVVSVDRKSDDIYQIEMTLKGEITIPCDRCLDDMQWAVDTSYDLSVKEGDEYDDSVDNVLTIPSHWRELDLEPLLRDTVLLTIPIKHVHPGGLQCPDARAPEPAHGRRRATALGPRRYRKLQSRRRPTMGGSEKTKR